MSIRPWLSTGSRPPPLRLPVALWLSPMVSVSPRLPPCAARSMCAGGVGVEKYALHSTASVPVGRLLSVNVCVTPALIVTAFNCCTGLLIVTRPGGGAGSALLPLAKTAMTTASEGLCSSKKRTAHSAPGRHEVESSVFETAMSVNAAEVASSSNTEAVYVLALNDWMMPRLIAWLMRHCSPARGWSRYRRQRRHGSCPPCTTFPARR